MGCEHDRPFLPQGTGREGLGRNRGYQRIRLPPDSERNVTDRVSWPIPAVGPGPLPDCVGELGVAEGMGSGGVDQIDAVVG
jgi:hypothetical protein